MTLQATVVASFADFTLDVDIECASGETVAIVGPNGAGKTTLLRAIAGLQPVDGGRITSGGVALDDLPPEARSVGFAFQDHVLFPHLDVTENIAFGLRARGARASTARVRAAEWLDRVGMATHGRSMPRELSGGQAQRVALARALATAPDVLLLDEPLAALDVATRNDTRRFLREHLAAFEGPRLVVTHDAVDAAALADRVVVLDAGRVVQVGTPSEITARPRHQWVADLAGINLYRGVAIGGRVGLSDGGVLAITDASTDGPVYAAIEPRAVALSRGRPDGSARNVWEGRVAAVEAVGNRRRVRVDATPSITAEITSAAGDDLGVVAGAAVWVAVKATEIDVYPA
ncbi:MAG TPA: ABC transporter ATP-binding protein [Acidimicrobiales bacterium]|nr:ABC transporter ATP-binding protein [Acidimicrobiales bacterium]